MNDDEIIVMSDHRDYIFGQFRETARCRDVQHGDGVCCAFAPQLVFVLCCFGVIISE